MTLLGALPAGDWKPFNLLKGSPSVFRLVSGSLRCGPRGDQKPGLILVVQVLMPHAYCLSVTPPLGKTGIIVKMWIVAIENLIALQRQDSFARWQDPVGHNALAQEDRSHKLDLDDTSHIG
jgi:hypothetical protein